MKTIKKLEDIDERDIYYMTEYQNYYYVKLKEEGLGLWKIDKNSHVAELTDTVSYVCDPIGPNGETLKELAKIIIAPNSF